MIVTSSTNMLQELLGCLALPWAANWNAGFVAAGWLRGPFTPHRVGDDIRTQYPLQGVARDNREKYHFCITFPDGYFSCVLVAVYVTRVFSGF